MPNYYTKGKGGPNSAMNAAQAIDPVLIINSSKYSDAVVVLFI